MKLSEITNLPDTIKILFDHFEKNKIFSGWSEIKDFDPLFEELMKSEFHRFSYLCNTGDFFLNFIPPNNNDACYMFDCKDSDGKSELSVMIDLVKTGTSFINFLFPFEKYPAFITELLNEKSELKISTLNEKDKFLKISDDEILSLDEFKGLIENISVPDKVKIIVVD